TAAVNNLLGGDELMKRSRTPEILADAAMEIFSRDKTTCTGQFFIDDEVMREAGVKDLSKYRYDPTVKEEDLAPDFFV
ncbi:MAG: short chain dehydrogenase, partial [Bacteroidota bacterium]